MDCGGHGWIFSSSNACRSAAAAEKARSGDQRG
jgi:hypothetical protein